MGRLSGIARRAALQTLSSADVSIAASVAGTVLRGGLVSVGGVVNVHACRHVSE